MTAVSKKMESTVFFVLLISTTLLFLYLVRVLLIPIFYGVVFTIVLYPAFLKVKKLFRGREFVSAIVTILLSVLVLLAIFSFLGGLVARDAVDLFETATQKVDSLAPSTTDLWNKIKSFLPATVLQNLSEINLREQIVNGLQGLAQGIFNSLQSLAGNAVRILGLSVVTFYATFYFLKNGHTWLRKVARITPLQFEDEKHLATRFVAMVRASLKMIFVMGAVQGFLGGLIFALLGIGSPFFWGLIFALLSLVPGLGHYIVWIPASIIFLITGAPVKAIILAAYGLLVMATSDDLLRPFLVGRSVQIHPFLIFVATIGGILTFGFTGLILGPVVASLTLTMWEIYEKRYA